LIKIRYADLPPGLHVRAEANGRDTIIYLLPGLTHAERRAALLRVRRSASMGHGPCLPASRVAAAVARNRITATTRNGAAAFRAHPLLLLPPVLIVASATLVYVMLSAVSVTFPHAAPGPPGALGPAPAPGRARAHPGSSAGYQSGPQAPGGQAGRGSGRGSGPASRSGPGSGSDSGSPGSVPGGGVAGSGSPAPDPPDPGSSAPASAGPGSSPTAAASAAAPSPTPTSAPAAPLPSPSASSGVCLNLIVVGVCVS
jgi:hypothetical protein